MPLARDTGSGLDPLLCPSDLLQTSSTLHPPSVPECCYSVRFVVIIIPARVFSELLCDNKNKYDCVRWLVILLPVMHQQSSYKPSILSCTLGITWGKEKVEICYRYLFLLYLQQTKLSVFLWQPQIVSKSSHALETWPYYYDYNGNGGARYNQKSDLQRYGRSCSVLHGR
jgi:hypothetical protein